MKTETKAIVALLAVMAISLTCISLSDNVKAADEKTYPSEYPTAWIEATDGSGKWYYVDHSDGSEWVTVKDSSVKINGVDRYYRTSFVGEYRSGFSIDDIESFGVQFYSDDDDIIVNHILIKEDTFVQPQGVGFTLDAMKCEVNVTIGTKGFVVPNLSAALQTTKIDITSTYEFVAGVYDGNNINLLKTDAFKNNVPTEFNGVKLTENNYQGKDPNYSKKGTWSATNAGTYTAKIIASEESSIFTGTVTIKWTINPAILSETEVLCPSYNYNEIVSPIVNVSFNNNTLVEGKDYILTYSKQYNVGEYELTIIGVGNYTGTMVKMW